MAHKKYFIFLLILLLYGTAYSFAADSLSVAGTWHFQIDRDDKGVENKWFNTVLNDKIILPGSMAGNNKGDDITLDTRWTGSIYDSSFYFHPRLEKYRKQGNIKIPFWLTPAKHYVGAAWYQKEVTIPQNCQGKRVVLFLEQAHTETILWVDGRKVGMQNTMVAPHEYDLTPYIAPGKHILTIRIDNRIKEINVGPDSHSLTDHTQGNWNGINGRMYLKAENKFFVDDVQVYPDLSLAQAKLKIALVNRTERPVNGELLLSLNSFNNSVTHQTMDLRLDFSAKAGVDSLEVIFPIQDYQAWDEFNPNLYRMKVVAIADGSEIAQKEVTFGMREFKAVGRDFYINGRKVFLRGTVDNAVFPLTGYPDTDLESWLRIMRKCKSYGLNHIRYHSWCPPEAAFMAADIVGMYLQPEGPSWANHGSSIGNGKPIDKFIYDETKRMAKYYGNYASFCMMAYGNEPRGRQVEYLTEFNNYWKAKDSRRLYTGASVGGSWPVIPNNEFMVRAGARGLDWNRQPESISDYSQKIKDFSVPFVAHEMGQYCAFPNFEEINKYSGIYKAKNFELFQEDLADHHMASRAHDFLMASGKLQALCYKYEIERALRTPNYSGFQLLSLNDYPGQGSALVGVLDAFWDEKGYTDSIAFRRFCNEVVPLSRLKQFVFQSDDTLRATVEVANYAAAELKNSVVTARLRDENRKVLFSWKFKGDLPVGHTLLGELNWTLSAITKATRLNLEYEIEGTGYINDWDVWVYPAKLPVPGGDVYYTTELDDKAKAILARGGKVFLNAAGKVVKGKEVVQHFLPVFWNTSWFKMRPPHTLGITLDPQHPAFKDFPTSYHSELQWWEILNRQQVMVLEDFPANFRPLVQPIDTWFMNRRLAAIFEAKAGGGKLIVSSSDLSPSDKHGPAAKQLYFSLINYMNSTEFNPEGELDLAVVADIFKTPTKQQFNTFTNDSPDELKPNNNNNPK